MRRARSDAPLRAWTWCEESSWRKKKKKKRKTAGVSLHFLRPRLLTGRGDPRLRQKNQRQGRNNQKGGVRDKKDRPKRTSKQVHSDEREGNEDKRGKREKSAMFGSIVREKRTSEKGLSWAAVAKGHGN